MFAVVRRNRALGLLCALMEDVLSSVNSACEPHQSCIHPSSLLFFYLSWESFARVRSDLINERKYALEDATVWLVVCLCRLHLHKQSNLIISPLICLLHRISSVVFFPPFCWKNASVSPRLLVESSE